MPETDGDGNVGSRKPWITPCAALLAVAIFATDLLIPLGVAHGVLYVAVVLLTTWSPRLRAPLHAGAGCAVLVLLGWWLSPTSGLAWMVVANRAISIGAIGVTASVCFLRNMDERRLLERERALHRERSFADDLVEAAPLIVLVLDRNGRVVRFNSYAEKLTGCPQDKAVGKDWLEVFVPESDRPRIRALFEAARDGAEFNVTNNAITTADGNIRLIEWTGTTLAGTDGNAIGVLALGKDITDRRQLEEEFQQAQKMEAVGRLAGGIAHDFNNLLMGIMGCCKMSFEQLPHEHAARVHVEEIMAAAKRASSLTRQLLDFSRKRSIELRPVALNALVSQKRPMLGRLLGEDIELRIALHPTDPAVLADPSQIDQILMNLVLNARDAMPGGGTLSIHTAIDEPHADNGSHPAGHSIEGQRIQLVVTDTGCGIQADARRKVFEPFYTTKEPGKGTGLGLATVYGLVEQLGGHIHLESEVGRGTSFRVCLPLTEERVPTEPAPAAATPDGRAGGSILLVEDERLVRACVRHSLQKNGYHVLDAADPARALTLFEEHGSSIDLLLTDMVMPGMDGNALAEEVRRRQPDIRVLFMSAHSPEMLAEQGRLEPGVETLQKPFDDEDLLARVQDALADGTS